LHAMCNVYNIPYNTFYHGVDLGAPAGGGAAVDKNAALSMMGWTNGAGFPVVPLVGGTSRPFGSLATDAIRAVYDMLPPGVGRTDLTGDQGSWVRTSGDGGTTPLCGLLPFGRQIGMGLPPLQRMMIDWEGPSPGPGVNATLLVDVPPAASTAWGAALRVGYPLTSPLPTLQQIEDWVNMSSATIFFYPTVPTNGTQRFMLSTLPLGSLSASMQLVFFLNAPVCSSNPNTIAAATPAIFLHY